MLTMIVSNFRRCLHLLLLLNVYFPLFVRTNAFENYFILTSIILNILFFFCLFHLMFSKRVLHRVYRVSGLGEGWRGEGFFNPCSSLWGCCREFEILILRHSTGLPSCCKQATQLLMLDMTRTSLPRKRVFHPWALLLIEELALHWALVTNMSVNL